MIRRARRAQTGVDDYNNPVYGEPVFTELDDAFTAPRTSESLSDQERAGVVIGRQLFLPQGTDLVYTDQVEIDGVVWELDGEPEDWTHPGTGWRAGMVAQLTRGKG